MISKRLSSSSGIVNEYSRISRPMYQSTVSVTGCPTYARASESVRRSLKSSFSWGGITRKAMGCVRAERPAELMPSAGIWRSPALRAASR